MFSGANAANEELRFPFEKFLKTLFYKWFERINQSFEDTSRVIKLFL